MSDDLPSDKLNLISKVVEHYSSRIAIRVISRIEVRSGPQLVRNLPAGAEAWRARGSARNEILYGFVVCGRVQEQPRQRRARFVESSQVSRWPDRACASWLNMAEIEISVALVTRKSLETEI